MVSFCSSIATLQTNRNDEKSFKVHIFEEPKIIQYGYEQFKEDGNKSTELSEPAKAMSNFVRHVETVGKHLVISIMTVLWFCIHF